MPRDACTVDVPFIPGDGVGPEVMAATRLVVDSAVRSATDDRLRIRWMELAAGESALSSEGEWLPQSTISSIRRSGVALKGPLTTPVGGGVRSLNVALRQVLDLYASVRPVKHFPGVPSPVKNPDLVDLVIFRENTEDVYKGIEWRHGSDEAARVRAFLRDSMGIDLGDDTGIGLKPISERASKRLARAAISHAVSRRRRAVTFVHKGNIMKFTEGSFRDWGYEVAEQEFQESVVLESRLEGRVPDGKVLVNDRIADNMFQQVLTRPSEYSVLATTNLNGDYLADACAAQIGGLGFAPGANLGDGVGVFEPVHGSAPKYAGRDVANPAAMMLSGAMMLEYLGLGPAADAVVEAIAATIAQGVVTQDVARAQRGLVAVGTRRFAEEVVLRL